MNRWMALATSWFGTFPADDHQNGEHESDEKRLAAAKAFSHRIRLKLEAIKLVDGAEHGCELCADVERMDV
ncbi:hypothetical protein AXG93_4476s1040 [Marchantia polymorpha subsp. ruderalis]|uniref:Uncharacterized protein n=1 Tax=Marchantia polymorpha subsp. ruderalis TaxID=1480154 RepID=A0A176W532_MARPO|nr:hypothetical protein AXG93_4476s1040 [Marchantia polymorpha subsp. ruderalis]